MGRPRSAAPTIIFTRLSPRASSKPASHQTQENPEAKSN